jgi:hypothetical protein
MKRILLTLALVAGILFTTAWAQKGTPRTWEYKFVYQCDEKKTNNLAAEAWELDQMSMASYGSIGVATCVFKRAK